MSRIKESSIERLKEQVDIIDVISHFIELKKSGANFKACCPFHGEETPSFVVNISKKIYHCFGCGAGGDSIKFVMEYENLSYPEAIEKVAAITNFTLEYEDNEYRPQQVKKTSKPKQLVNKVEYQYFNPAKKRFADIRKGMKNYITLPMKYKMMLIYTYIYNFSLNENQSKKIEYFRKRRVNINHSKIKELGFISVESFDKLVQELIDNFGLEILVDLEVLNNVEHKAPFSFKLWYVKKGGVIVFPSFHIYQTNLVTSFMFRPTQPDDWMIEAHMKEIQMSNTDLISSVPYGLTYDFIANTNAIKCLVEGGPDTLCNDEQFKGKDFLFIGSPGTHGFKEKHISLLKGQKLRIMLDPDNAGQMAAYGSITIQSESLNKRFLNNKKGIDELNIEKKYLDANGIKYFVSKQDGYIQKCLNAGVIPEICSWDSKFGDMNEVRKLALSGKAPFKNMEEFLTKFVSVKKISSLKN
jgi:hypothetical protein